MSVLHRRDVVAVLFVVAACGGTDEPPTAAQEQSVVTVPEPPREPTPLDVRATIERLHQAGRTPRIHVNGVHDGVVCPQSVLERWRDRLVIDLDPSYPLDLRLDDDAVEADLSFDGHVARCRFPFRAIYVVVDRDAAPVLDQHRDLGEGEISEPPSRTGRSPLPSPSGMRSPPEPASRGR